MVFCWDEGELVLCGRMVQGRWGCWEDECWGFVLGILGAVGEGEGRFVFMFFFFGLEKDFGAHLCFRMVLGTTAGWDKKL